MNADTACDCVTCAVSRWMSRPWRTGGQVGRTIYIDHEEKDDRLLIAVALGDVDDARKVARHIVEAHNAYVETIPEPETAMDITGLAPIGRCLTCGMGYPVEKRMTRCSGCGGRVTYLRVAEFETPGE